MILPKAIVDFGKKEYAASLSFITVSRVCSLNSIIFWLFTFKKLERIKKSKKLQERKDEEKRLASLII